MLPRGKYKTEWIIGFEYVKKKRGRGYRWHLTDQIIDPETMEMIGLKGFQLPTIIKLPPQSILRDIYRALSDHHLDGGIVDELPTIPTVYGVLIPIKERAMKPNQ